MWQNKEIQNRKYMPNLLLVAGGGRNVGKTWLVCRVIEHFSKQMEIMGMKISPHFHNHGIEYKENGKDFFIEKEPSSTTGKDSSLMLKHGAKKVYYVETTDQGMQRNIIRLEKVFADIPTICESGGLAEFIEPGIFIFIQEKSKDSDKNKSIKNKANIILDNDNGKVYFDVTKIRLVNGEWHYKNSKL